MAAQASKRRKTEHTSSDEKEEDLSLASFSDAESQDRGQDEVGFSGFDSDVDERGENIVDASQRYGNASDEIASADDASENLSDDVGPSENEIEATPKSMVMSRREANGRVNRSAMGSAGTAYAAGTSKSNVFFLQVDELLAQIRPRHGTRETEAEAALHILEDSIKNIPPRAALPVEEAERQLLMSSKISVPFPNPRPPKDAKYKLEYAKPSNINVVGSYATKTASRAKALMKVDVVVTMPPSMFQEKDYLNHRYYYKRAYFLACLAAGLEERHAKAFRMRFRHSHDDPLKPILVVTPLLQSDGTSEKRPTSRWQINIIPCIQVNVFFQDKLLPDRNCVRTQARGPSNGTQADQAYSATPFYNSSLRSDMLMTSYLKLILKAAKSCSALQDACVLGSTWLRQRGIGSNIHAGGFGSFEWSAVIALLLQGGGSGGRPMLSAEYSSYQLLKATLQLLAMRNLSKQPLLVGERENTHQPPVNGRPMLWDGMRGHNVLYKMTPWTYELLRREAKTTLKMLGDQRFDAFQAMFILRTDKLLYRYDYVLKLDASLVNGGRSEHDHNTLEAYLNLYEILQQGLGDRASLINIMPQWCEAWELGSAGRSKAMEKKLLIGLIVNPETVNRTIDHGPSAESKAGAAAFRTFWGEKAELRRFRDGSILETLVWSGNESGQSVLEQIVRYLVQKHFGGESERTISTTGDAFKRMLPQSSRMTAFQPLMEAYNQLESGIRNLDALPLSVRQIMPADAQLCYSSIALPLSGRRLLPANVTLQFEGSARWPDDLVAIQRTKLAFLLKLSELLQDSVNSATARIGLENGEHNILNQAFLDIIYDSGAAFHLRIHHDREQTLLEKRLKEKTIDPSSKQVAALGLAKYKRDYIRAPAHTQAIARLCGRYPAMSGAIRLMKKWFAAHLLSNHMAGEVIELLVARTFVQAWPWQTPSSLHSGFLRTLLWISRWDWKADPLIVDLSGSGELKQPDFKSISATFEAWRKLDPALNRIVLFAASDVDPDGTTWTDGRPTRVVAGRMTTLARAACAEVEEQQLQLDPASLFSSPLSDFDFIVHLNPEFNGKKSQRKQAKSNGVVFKNLEIDLMNDTTLTGYNPVRDFTNELETLYGSAVLLFSGGHERPVITGLWTPQTAPRSWKLNLAYSTIPKKQPDNDGVHASINKETILAEIANLGGDMVGRIEVNNH